MSNSEMYSVFKIFIVSIVYVVPLATGQLLNGLQCQRITASTCQGLGYNMTSMPNLAGHTNQLDAEMRVGQMNKLITFR